MKNIIHFKFDLNEYQPDVVGKFLKFLQERLGEDFQVIASPFDPSMADIQNNNLKLYNFQLNEISIEELKKLIRKENQNAANAS